jgi:hypothetical protein
MRPLIRHSWANACSWALRAYLCLFMVGCGAHRPDLSQVRDMETRLMAGDETNAYQACVNTLQDLGYTIEVADLDAGILTASRSTHERSGQITEEREDPNHKGMPAWGWALLIVTGVIVIVAAAAVLSHDDDGQDAHKDQDKAGHQQKAKRKHHEEPPPAPAVVAYAPDPPTSYVYLITINVQRQDQEATRVRVSLQGTEFHGDELVRTGPVEDPGFFERFYAALDQSLRIEQGQESRLGAN